MADSFEEKKRRLVLLENGRGINYLLKEAYKIVRNPMLMIDTRYHLIANNEGVVTDDPIWNEIIALGTFTHATVDFFNKENFIEAFAQAEIVSFMKSDKLKYNRANIKLFDKTNMMIASIVVLACSKPFEEGDEILFEMLSGILSAELQNSEFYEKMERIYQESMVSKLINSNVADQKMDKAKKANLYKELKTNVYLAVVDIMQYEHTLTHLAYFRDLFKRVQSEYKYYIHMEYIVIIVSTDNAMLNVKTDLGALNKFFGRYQIYAGVSSKFQDLAEVREHYREAVNALNCGLKSKRRQHIFLYDSFRIEPLLNRVIKNTIDMQEICNPVVFSIKEYDRKNNTALLEVLYTYLLYGMDGKPACAQLGISRMRLKRQLKTLRGLFGIEWEDGDMLYNIFLSIKMLECVHS